MIPLQYHSCLVTGGAGFIGSHICEEAIKQGKRVVCVDNLVAGKMLNIEHLIESPNFTFVNADVSDLSTIANSFKGIDVVFHNAASKCTVCRNDPHRDLMVNAWGTYNVLEASRIHGVKKVILASTGSVYGQAQSLPQDENHRLNPCSYYGVSKLCGERYGAAFTEYYGMNISVIRYYHVYGPRQDSSDVGGVVPIFIRRALEDKPLIIYGDGSQLRSFTYVKDDVYANFILANSEDSRGEAYNCASGLRITIKELADTIRRIMGKASLCIKYKPWRPGDIKIFDVDNAKIKALGASLSMSFEEGLRETIKWYSKRWKNE